MGTRADFYVARGEDAEYLGSIAWDGYEIGQCGTAKTELQWRALVRNLAEVSKMAATESVRSLRSMLSALQSVAASARSESELAGRGYE